MATNTGNILLHFNGQSGDTVFPLSGTDNVRAENVGGNICVNTSVYKFGGGSGYFPGITGNYIKISYGGTFSLGGSSIIDFWIRLTGNNGVILSSRNQSSGFEIYAENRKIKLWVGNAVKLSSSTSLSLNTWYYICISKDYYTNIARLYVNGSVEYILFDANFDISAPYNVGYVYIGDSTYSSNPLTGYLDEFRCVAGQSYTSGTISVPSSEYAIEYDPNSNGFIDVASYNKVYLPFAGIASDDRFRTNFASGFFSGTKCSVSGTVETVEGRFGNGVLLYNATISNSGCGAIFSNDFTIDLYVKLPTISSNVKTIFRLVAYPHELSLSYDDSGSTTYLVLTAYYSPNNILKITCPANDFTVGVWHHIFVGRKDNTFYIALNGIMRELTYVIGSRNIDLGFLAEPSTSFEVSGYLYVDNVRVLHRFCAWTSDFVPPRKEYYRDVPIAGIDGNTVLCLHCDGENNSTTFTDSSYYNHTVTAYGNAKIKTNVYKFGTGSLYCATGGDYLQITSPNKFNVNSSTGYSIDFWVKPENAPTSSAVVFQQKVDDNNRHFIQLEKINSDYYQWRYKAILNGTMIIDSGTNNISLNDVTNLLHYAVFVKDNKVAVFVNGSRTSYGNINGTFQLTNTPITIGTPTSGDGFNGWIDEIRVCNPNNINAYYYASFPPPTIPYYDYQYYPLGYSESISVTATSSVGASYSYYTSVSSSMSATATMGATAEAIYGRVSSITSTSFFYSACGRFDVDILLSSSHTVSSSVQVVSYPTISLSSGCFTEAPSCMLYNMVDSITATPTTSVIATKTGFADASAVSSTYFEVDAYRVYAYSTSVEIPISLSALLLNSGNTSCSIELGIDATCITSTYNSVSCEIPLSISASALLINSLSSFSTIELSCSISASLLVNTVSDIISLTSSATLLPGSIYNSTQSIQPLLSAVGLCGGIGGVTSDIDLLLNYDYSIDVIATLSKKFGLNISSYMYSGGLGGSNISIPQSIIANCYAPSITNSNIPIEMNCWGVAS